jgi:hypothetical protein
MLLHLVAAGAHAGLGENGYRDYADRLRADYRMALTEIPLGKRSGDEVTRAVAAEVSECSPLRVPHRRPAGAREAWSTARLAR